MQLVTVSTWGCELSGAIPHAIRIAGHLRSLNAAANRLVGSLPRALGQLQKLSSLKLAMNHLSGNIAPELFAGTAESLQILELRVNGISGSLPGALAQSMKIEEMWIETNEISGPMPGAMAGMQSLVHLVARSNDLSGALPDACGQLAYLEELQISSNDIGGSLPSACGGMTPLALFDIEYNKLEGSLPEAIGQLVHLEELRISYTGLSGTLPDACGNAKRLRVVGGVSNRLSGCLPASLGHLLALRELGLSKNHLSGPLLDSLSLSSAALAENRLAGSLPRSIASLTYLDIRSNQLEGSASDYIWITFASWRFVNIGSNHLSGSLPALSDGLHTCWADRNRLIGSLPTTPTLGTLNMDDNKLRGGISSLLHAMPRLRRLSISKNELTGVLPYTIGYTRNLLLVLSNNLFAGSLPPLFSGHWLDVADNQLIGSFPQGMFSRSLTVLRCGRNLLEGRLPWQASRSSELDFLDIPGTSGRSNVDAVAGMGLRGPLPTALARIQKLSFVLAHSQRLEGNIPRLIGTMFVLSMHGNCLKMVPQLHFSRTSRPIILLHNNLLSCKLPTSDKDSLLVDVSLLALGNQLRHPGREFPSWVSPIERDDHFWTSADEGMKLSFKIVCAMGALLGSVVVNFRALHGLNGFKLIIWKWRNASFHRHVYLTKLSMHLAGSLAHRSLLSAVFLLVLSDWRLFRCPRTLALASACLRKETCVHFVVILLWFHFRSQPCVRSLCYGHSVHTSAAANRKVRAAKRCVLWLVWLCVSVMLSTLVMIDLAGRSVPGLVHAPKPVLHFISVSVGSMQAVVTNMAIPYLARRLTISKYAFASVSSFLSTCLFPMFVVFYLNSACGARWLAWWEPCSLKHHAKFKRVLHCLDDKRCGMHEDIDIRVLDREDVCTPSGDADASTCMTIALLQLQDTWLSKLITSGLLIPAARMSFGFYFDDSAEAVMRLALLLEFALFASGPLPLLSVLLLLSCLSEMLLSAVSAENGALQGIPEEGVARWSVRMTQVLALILHLALVAGDEIAFGVMRLVVLATFAHQFSSARFLAASVTRLVL